MHRACSYNIGTTRSTFGKEPEGHRFGRLANLGVQVLDDTQHKAASLLANAWKAANAWSAEPDYALDRLRSLRSRRGG